MNKTKDGTKIISLKKLPDKQYLKLKY